MTPFELNRLKHAEALKADAERRSLGSVEEVVEEAAGPPGPGTFLRRALGSIGIQPRGEKCKCNERAKLMDERGADWCEANAEEIIDWLEEEAKNRPLVGRLFNRTAAGFLVSRCIRQAREAAKV
jgi:hypothetical protein